ncbi:hypothetical protein SAMN02745784_01051 [Tissierella praeacuta DSM 18095]|uniref:GIY-YIG catalytic domain-containing protein n=2 Tax=Tissierella praeacuta TaxID=43131 RepID=A0A1M4UF28_9FIRM|nr:GIY-YIG nuclease family protein [Tissierella praeacuta]TCU77188.1 hypothetical protein EV204_10246 [Tissierella praeacuta]SHE55345.1 hypothetical protein SAMN02745784_01051 [Tissierella praeacuta DSM 18095]SUP03915.1 Uncharacterised protein [Tissierella praeacuta]
MGIFIIRSNSNNKYYIEATQDLKIRMNREIFQLKWGSHPNKELQKDWDDFGESNLYILGLVNLQQGIIISIREHLKERYDG